MPGQRYINSDQEPNPYLECHHKCGDDSKPPVHLFVGHVACGDVVLGPGHGEVWCGKTPVKIVEGVKVDQQQGDRVQEEAEAVVERVLPGQDGAGPELLEDKLRPPPPLRVEAHQLTGPQPPDTAEACEELGAGRVTVEYPGGEE